MATEKSLSDILLTSNGSNYRPWKASILNQTAALGRDLLCQGGIQFVLKKEKFTTTFGMPPTTILTPANPPVAGVNYSSIPPATNSDDFRLWLYLDGQFKATMAVQLAVRTIILRTLSVAHQDTIHGGSEYGMMNFSAEQIVTKITELYDKPSDIRVKALKSIIERPYRSKDDNWHAHAAQNLSAVTELAQLRNEVVLDSTKFEALYSTIQQPDLVNDLHLHFDYHHRSLNLRTYAALTAHMTEHAEGVMAAGGGSYPTSLAAHAVVGDHSVANAMAAAVGNPELQGVIAAFQISKLSSTPAQSAPAKIPNRRQRVANPHGATLHVVPHPKPVPVTIKYCWCHGYSLATTGHSSIECTIMQTYEDPETKKPYTVNNRNATAHVRNADGTAYGSYRHFKLV